MYHNFLHVKLIPIAFLLLTYSVTNDVCFAVENDERAFAYGSRIDISENPEAVEKENLEKIAQINAIILLRLLLSADAILPPTSYENRTYLLFMDLL